MKRLFIAIKIEAGTALNGLLTDLKALLRSESIKWVDIQNIHVTLAFLGDTDERKIIPLKEMMKERCSGSGEFEFTLAGTGVFKSFRDPRVIWAGITESEKLYRLNAIITGGLKSAGFTFDEKPFSPHLTLGRIRSLKDPENLKQVLDRYRLTEFQVVSVREVILFESILTQSVPVYKSLARFSLA